MVANLTGDFPGSLFEEFQRLQRDMDEFYGSGSWSGIRSQPRVTFPAVNVGSTPDRVVVYVFAPGVDPKALDITVQQNLLSVAGKREIPVNENATYYRQERFSGEFRRVMSLPDDVDPERVEAKYRDGIVYISVERRAEAKPRRIEIH